MGLAGVLFYQDEWPPVKYRKPTGLHCNAGQLRREQHFHQGWPQLDDKLAYVGPLPRREIGGQGPHWERSRWDFPHSAYGSLSPGTVPSLCRNLHSLLGRVSARAYATLHSRAWGKERGAYRIGGGPSASYATSVVRFSAVALSIFTAAGSHHTKGV